MGNGRWLSHGQHKTHTALLHGAELNGGAPSPPSQDLKKPAARARPRATHPPTTVRTSFSMSALMYIRPRRSVWSVPHKLGTFITQRLCTFIMQAAERRKGSAPPAVLPQLTGEFGVG